MNIFMLLLMVILAVVVALYIRSMVRIYKRPKHFLLFSICMLSISLVFLVIGTFILLFVSDTLGGALTGLGGFFGLLESNIRHKREAAGEEIY